MSLRRCAALLCEVVAGLAIARRTSGRQFVWFVFTCSLAWLCLGLLAELSLGTFRPFSAGHRFAGVFHPNMMGVNAALLVLAAYYLATTGDRRRRLVVIAIGVVALVFLVLTRSRTSISAMLLAIATMWLFTAPVTRKVGHVLFMTVVAMGISTAVALGMFQLSTTSLSMGRTDNEIDSFTGRVPLWQVLVNDYVPDNAMLGYGYGAFWSADRIAEISKSQNWATTHAHSTYIDLVLNVGCVGAALCLAIMVLALSASLRREVASPGSGMGFVAMLIVFGLASGVLETYIGHTWFLTFFGITGVCYLVCGGRLESRDEVSCGATSPTIDVMPIRRDATSLEPTGHVARRVTC
jgi:oligosaccharide repeat unit polymerase